MKKDIFALFEEVHKDDPKAEPEKLVPGEEPAAEEPEAGEEPPAEEPPEETEQNGGGTDGV